MHRDGSNSPPRRYRLGATGHGPWLLASSLVLAVLVAPFAIAAGEGKPVNVGKRNPARGAAARTTQLHTNLRAGGYGLRVDNRGAGGSAVLRCRSRLGTDVASERASTACLRGINTAAGEAFQFVTARGTLAGVIQTGSSLATPNPNARPFVTNATGEAFGLNADKVDGLNAADIVAQARQQSPAGSAPSFAFARVSAAGATDQSRSQGVTDANIQKPDAGLYCFYQLSSRPKSANVTLDGVPGETSVDTTSGAPCPNPAQLDLFVRTYDSAGSPADKPFYISITGTTGG